MNTITGTNSRTRIKIVAIGVIFALLLGDVALADQSFSFRGDNSALSSVSRLNQMAQEVDFQLSVESHGNSFDLQRALKEDAGLLYISGLIKKILKQYGNEISANGLRDIIKSHLQHADLGKVDLDSLTKEGKTFSLPYVNARGERLTIRYSSSEGTNVSENLTSYVKDKNILFASFRLNHEALDGVSLEAYKWAATLDQAGANVYYYSGETRDPPFIKGSRTFPLAHFVPRNIAELTEKIFKQGTMDSIDYFRILKAKEKIKDDFREYCKKNKIESIITENVLSFPANIALSLAIMDVAEELNIEIIAHNHDFWWERLKFRNIAEPLQGLLNEIERAAGKLSMIVINGIQRDIMEETLDVQYELMQQESPASPLPQKNVLIAPNVMDFENPPVFNEIRIKEFKEFYGVEDDDIFMLMPARPIKRKDMKRAVDICAELNKHDGSTVKLMVTHPAGDEGFEYWERIKRYAETKQGVELIDKPAVDLAWAQENPQITRDDLFTLEDSYHACDMVVYTSVLEGWGNALVEALYYKKPVIINPYRVYRLDIKPKGVKCIEISNQQPITKEHLDQIVKVLKDPSEDVEHNFQVGYREFSYIKLREVLTQTFREIRSSFVQKEKKKPWTEDEERRKILIRTSPEYIFKIFLVKPDKWMSLEEVAEATGYPCNSNLKSGIRTLIFQSIVEQKDTPQGFMYRLTGQGLHDEWIIPEDVFIRRMEVNGGEFPYNSGKRQIPGKLADYKLPSDDDLKRLTGTKMQNEEKLTAKDIQENIQELVDATISASHALGGKIIIGLDTGWIPKIQKDMDATQQMIRGLKELCKKNGIALCVNSNPERLAELIAKQMEKGQELSSLSEVVIIGRDEVLNFPCMKAFMGQNDEKGAFFARIKGDKDLPRDANIDIVRMLAKILNHAFDPSQPRIYYFDISNAERVDLQVLMKEYERMSDALLKSA